jgi:hypothetical protein
MNDEIICYKCLKALGLSSFERVTRHEECPSCYANIRSCKMCMFYSESAYNECKEPMANRILEKENANFCDYFKIGNGQKESSGEDPLAAAKALFKN